MEARRVDRDQVGGRVGAERRERASATESSLSMRALVIRSANWRWYSSAFSCSMAQIGHPLDGALVILDGHVTGGAFGDGPPVGVRCGSHACGHQARNSWRMAAARVWSYPIPYAIGARIALDYAGRPVLPPSQTVCGFAQGQGRVRQWPRRRPPAGRSGTSRLPARRSTAIPVGDWQRRGRRPGLRPVHSGT